jgi:hypothetical protein
MIYIDTVANKCFHNKCANKNNLECFYRKEKDNTIMTSETKMNNMILICETSLSLASERPNHTMGIPIKNSTAPSMNLSLIARKIPTRINSKPKPKIILLFKAAIILLPDSSDVALT